MRGGKVRDLATVTTKAILMEHYNQRYSDLDDMPIKEVMFFLRLYEAKQVYEKQMMDKAKNKRGRR